jgi:hypothetical protein
MITAAAEARYHRAPSALPTKNKSFYLRKTQKRYKTLYLARLN